MDYGSTINVQWSVNNDGYQRVELWRYGSFVTRIYNSMHGYANTIKEINWHVEPGPQADAGAADSGPNKTYGSLRDGPNIVSGDAAGKHKAWLQFFRNFQPGDHYTVRALSLTLALALTLDHYTVRDHTLLTLTLDPNPNPTLG